MEDSKISQQKSQQSLKSKNSIRHSLETDLKRSFNFGFLKKKSSQNLQGSNSLFIEKPSKDNVNTTNTSTQQNGRFQLQSSRGSEQNKSDLNSKSQKSVKKRQSLTAEQLKNNISKEQTEKTTQLKTRQKQQQQDKKQVQGQQLSKEQNKLNSSQNGKGNINNSKIQTVDATGQQSQVKNNKNPKSKQSLIQTGQSQILEEISKKNNDSTLEDKLKNLKIKNFKPTSNYQEVQEEPSEQLSSNQQNKKDQAKKLAKNKSKVNIAQSQFFEKNQIKQQLEQSNRKQQVCMTAEEALLKYGTHITSFERNEITQYSQIYYCGQNADKLGCQSTIDVHGFDDQRGEYIPLVHDHLAYRFEILGILGRGSFGSVFKCYDHKQGCTRAVKVVRNRKRLKEQGMVEVGILDHIRRKDSKDMKSVVRMMQSFWFRDHLCISFEMLQDNLYELIKINNFQGVTLSLIKGYAYQILVALKFLRQQQIIHCDLKPENIMLKVFDNKSVKIIDFGSSCYQNQRIYTYIQSRFYRAPEVILGLPYSFPIDVWSFGCILAELYTGYPIFPGEDESEQMQCMMEIIGLPPQSMIKKSSRHKLFFSNGNSNAPLLVPNSRGKIRQPASKPLQKALKTSDKVFVSFLQGCLKWRPQDRLSPEEALEHPFLRDLVHVHKYTNNESTGRSQQQTLQKSATSNDKQPQQQNNNQSKLNTKQYDDGVSWQQSQTTSSKQIKSSSQPQLQPQQTPESPNEEYQNEKPSQSQQQSQQLQSQYISSKSMTSQQNNSSLRQNGATNGQKSKSSQQSDSKTSKLDLHSPLVTTGYSKGGGGTDLAKSQIFQDKLKTQNMSQSYSARQGLYTQDNQSADHKGSAMSISAQQQLQQQSFYTQADDYQSLLTLVKQESSEDGSEGVLYNSTENISLTPETNNQQNQKENKNSLNTQPGNMQSKKGDKAKPGNRRMLQTQQTPNKQGSNPSLQRHRSDNWVSQQAQGNPVQTQYTNNGERPRRISRDADQKTKRDPKKDKKERPVNGQKKLSNLGKLAQDMKSTLDSSFFMSKSRNAQTRADITRNASSRQNQPGNIFKSEIQTSALSNAGTSMQNKKLKQKNAIHLSFFTPRKTTSNNMQDIQGIQTQI